MRVLGIDPGTIHMGYGVVEGEGDQVTFVDCGVLNASHRDPIEKRLLVLYGLVQALIRRCNPEVVAVEEPFVVRAPRKSALAVGEARAIALLAAAGSALPVFQYTPSRVRQTVAGYGAGTKEQVREMVSLLLRRPLAGYSLDACDALAVAMCHVQQLRLSSLLDAAAQASDNVQSGRAAGRGRER